MEGFAVTNLWICERKVRDVKGDFLNVLNLKRKFAMSNRRMENDIS